MTIGLSSGNSNFSVAVADRQRSDSRQGRQLDAGSKMKSYKSNDFHGVLYGSGMASFLDRMKCLVCGLAQGSSEGVDDFVKAVTREHTGYFSKTKMKEMGRMQRAMDEEAKLYEDEEKARFLASKRSDIMTYIAKFVDQVQTELILDLYDKTNKRIRRYAVRSYDFESFNPSITSGSGSDLAQVFLNSEMTAKDAEQLSLEHHVFLAVGAAINATSNFGVGGTPQIMLIDEDGVKELERGYCAILTNLMGACNAGMIPRKRTIQHIESILKEEVPYEVLQKELGVDTNILQGTALTASQWLEFAGYQGAR